ncbi:MAG TPA: M20/M25/M40 family metallo-hydrolase, partial [Gaiellaceae bacterium]|nr:M20/M25/M40 family metallo-hydrolase [Gaiellaceae bacterium]
MQRAALIVAAALGIVVAALAAWASRGAGDGGEEPRAAGRSDVTAGAVERAVTREALVGHLRELQAIADRNGSTRETGSPGYDESVDYVVGALSDAGYELEIHRFRLPTSRDVRPPVLERAGPTPATYRAGLDYLTLEYSGSGDVTAPVEAVDVEGTTSGCEPDDFAGFSEGAVALVRRGGCFFFQKVANAEQAGAAAVLVYNDGGPGRETPVTATLLEPGTRIPVLGLASAVGEDLAATPGARVHVAAEVDNSERETANVIAELPGRSDAGVVLAGAHLDSVGAGPGINDNGSGVAAVLEAAVQLRRLGARPERGIRFAFWAGEELGLHGSSEYAEELGSRLEDEVALVLNFDMVGSPNFARLVYDADPEIADAFRRWFDTHGLAAAEVALEGRSDHAPFAERGIPVGGLFTGADEPKTAAEARLFGGRAG